MSASKQPASRPPARAEPEFIDPPRSIGIAVWLMYAGAAVTAISTVIQVIAIAVAGAALLASDKGATLAQLHATRNTLIVEVVFSGLIEVGLWLFVARANRAGLKWARLLASVLFALSCWVLAGTVLRGAAVTLVIFTGLTWLAGLSAIVFLWRRESSDYFNTPSAPSPSGRPAD